MQQEGLSGSTPIQNPLLNVQGLLEGLNVLTRCVDDSKIVAYLATNSCAGNTLGLKALAHEFAGNWAVEEIKDIRKLPKDKLLQYNLVDCLSTWYVFNKYYPMMCEDFQEPIYRSLMLPSLKTLLQMELVGMPMDAAQIQEAKTALQAKEASYLKVFETSPVIQEYNLVLREQAMIKANAKLKKKQHPLSVFDDVVLNPNSGPQLQGLLYEYMQLPVIDTTDTGLPATGGDTLKKLIHHTQNQEYLEVLHALVGLAGVSKILSAFIPNFEAAIDKGDGRVWLHGSFNLGGTVSGRLSASNPNLQQLPSGSDYGKLIKSCFSAPTGWIMVGADYNALEDRINTLLTKDPNKIKVFVDGYDSHCLRASKFFPEKLPGIVDTVESVNSIKKLFPEIRQLAKSPAFALQYSGTWITLHKTLGFSEEEAKKIEQGYRELYKVSEEWVDSKIQQASKQGYVDLAFGLRLRAPLLQQVIWGGPRVPGAASAEARTLGNAVSGQSYGLLNTRAANEFMQKVWASRYRYDVLPCAQIHDAQYYLVRDDVNVVEWVNSELIASMRWQELPEIQHDLVKLGGEMDLFWPDWAHPITLPNDADQSTIRKMCLEAKTDLKQAA